jgi:hypothetical protein
LLDHTKVFLKQWRDYLDVISSQKNQFGVDLEPSRLQRLSDDQKQQLQDLKEETYKAFTDEK